jgi:hypothetical protein
MTAGLSTIGPRLAKLLPLLSSDQAGEVVTTARAIGQTLKRGGMDWHDLAALVSGKGKRQLAPAFTLPVWRPHCPQADRTAGRTAGDEHDGPCPARAVSPMAAWAGGVGEATDGAGAMAGSAVAGGVWQIGVFCYLHILPAVFIRPRWRGTVTESAKDATLLHECTRWECFI